MSWKYNKKGESRSEIAKKHNFGNWMNGKKLSEEQKLKQSKTNKERGIGLWMNGKKLPDETKKKISDALKGRKKVPLSEETKEKISQKNKGKHYSLNTEFVKGNIPFLKGKHHTEEARIKISKAISGENSGNWHGGLSKEKPDVSRAIKLLRKRIRLRDNNICMCCGIHREKCKRTLTVHHIDYDKYNHLPSNLITLCDPCHAKTSFNRKSWITFFQSTLNRMYGYSYDNNIKEVQNEQKFSYGHTY